MLLIKKDDKWKKLYYQLRDGITMIEKNDEREINFD